MAGRPLSDPLPLRDNSVWPGYSSIETIPRIYGYCRIKARQYVENGRTFVLADHALTAVNAVYDGDRAISGWQLKNGSDMNGHAVAFLILSETPSGTITADVRGLSGNPADIIANIYPRNDLQDLAIECANSGIELGGALDSVMTLRAAIQLVVDQFGGCWAAGMPGFAKAFPPADDEPIYARFTALDLADCKATCSLENLITQLTVSYAWDYAAGKATGSVVLEANTDEYGERAGTLDLPWVTSARVAAQVGAKYLQWRARPLWTLTANCSWKYRSLAPGVWVDIQHPRLPVSGRWVLTDVDPGYGKGAVSLTAQIPAGLAPAVELMQSSESWSGSSWIIAEVQSVTAGSSGSDLPAPSSYAPPDADNIVFPGTSWVDDMDYTSPAADEIIFP